VRSEGADAYDAVVIGGGPAGSTAGRLLARRGFRTLIAEKSVPGGRSVCGGFAGPEIRRFWDALGGEPTFRPLLRSEIRRLLVSSGGGCFESELAETGWSVDRAGFDRALFEWAGREGAELLTETAAAPEGRAGGGWRVRLDGPGTARRVSCRWLIRAAGRRPPSGVRPERAYFACKAEYTGVLGLEEKVALHFVPWGHVGLNPLSAGTATLCLYVRGHYLREARGDLDGMMRRLVRENPNILRHLGEAHRASEWLTCAAVPDGRKVFFEEGAFRVGDAVTMAHPVIGGGISLAMGSAAVLAAALAESRDGGRSDGETADRYAACWKKLFDRTVAAAAFLGRLERSAAAARCALGLLRRAPAALGPLFTAARPSFAAIAVMASGAIINP
jgi:flavin-dependent dehydrogenase